MRFPTTPELRDWLIQKILEKPLEFQLRIDNKPPGREIFPGVFVNLSANALESAVRILEEFTKDLQAGYWDKG